MAPSDYKENRPGAPGSTKPEPETPGNVVCIHVGMYVLMHVHFSGITQRRSSAQVCADNLESCATTIPPGMTKTEPGDRTGTDHQGRNLLKQTNPSEGLAAFEQPLPYKGNYLYGDAT